MVSVTGLHRPRQCGERGVFVGTRFLPMTAFKPDEVAAILDLPPTDRADGHGYRGIFGRTRRGEAPPPGA